MNYYYSGFPYSEELYHHGIKGQRWGVRRYQNEDGSLTTLGKMHYGIQSVGSMLGKGVKNAGKYAIAKYKKNHPYLMSDEELQKEINKQKKVNEFKQLKVDYRSKTFRGKINNILWKAADTGVSKLAETTAVDVGKGMAKKILETNAERKTRRIKEKMERMDKEKALRNKVKQFKEEKSRAVNEQKNRADEERSRRQNVAQQRFNRAMRGASERVGLVNKGNSRNWGPNSNSFPDYKKIKEDEERKKKYGPGGSAYR